MNIQWSTGASMLRSIQAELRRLTGLHAELRLTEDGAHVGVHHLGMGREIFHAQKERPFGGYAADG